MTKYHISPKTKRPNICKAQGQCPLKTEDGKPAPHFNSKEEARAGVEKIEASKNSTFTKMKKTPTPTKRTSPEKLVEKGFTKAFKDHEGLQDHFSNLETQNWARSYNIVPQTTHPGCNGCEPPYDDYCRCEEYTGEVQVDREGLAKELIGVKEPTYYEAKNGKKNFYKTPEGEETLKKMEEYVRMISFGKTEDFKVNSKGGYYGEELDSIDLTEEGKYKLNFIKMRVLNDMNESKAKKEKINLINKARNDQGKIDLNSLPEDLKKELLEMLAERKAKKS